MTAKWETQNLALASAAFAAGALTFFNINLVGNFPLAEFVLLAILGKIALRVCLYHEWPGRFLRDPLLVFMLVAQAIAFIGYVVSDLYRDSSVFDIARGWSRMVFLAIDVLAIAFLYGEDARSFTWSQIGAATGAIASVQINGALFGDTWKFGYAAPVTLLVLIITPRFGLGVCALAAAAMGIVHSLMDYRSLGGLCFLSALLIALQLLPNHLRARILIPGVLLGGCAAFFFYTHKADDESRRGDRSDVERSSMLTAAWDGFRSSPFIGQGSWFGKSKVLDNFLAIRSEAAKLAGVHGYAEDEETDTVAIHSQLLVSVAEGGIVGGAFFLAFGPLLGWALLYCCIWRPPDGKMPVYLLTLLSAIWNLFLSPFSGAHRVFIAMGCGLILILWAEARQQKQLSRAEKPTLVFTDAIFKRGVL